MTWAPEGAGRYDRLHGDEDMRDELDTHRVLAKLDSLRGSHARELEALTHSEFIARLDPYEMEIQFHTLLRIWFSALALRGSAVNLDIQSMHKELCAELAKLDVPIEEAEDAVISDMQHERG